MQVTIKAAEGRRVFVQGVPLSDKTWATVPLIATVVKGIKNGDIIEATPVNKEETVTASLGKAAEAAGNTVADAESRSYTADDAKPQPRRR